MKKATWKRAASMLLGTMMIAAVVGTSATDVAAASTEQELRDQIAEYQQQLDEINQQIADAQQDKAGAESTKQLLEQQAQTIRNQISLLTTQISDTQSLISSKQEEIDQKQADIDQKQEDIDQRWEDFKLRMKAMQQLNDGGSITLLSSATNLYELLSFQQTLTDIYQKDEEVLSEMNAEYEELNAQKQELEEDKTELQSQMDALASQSSQLESKQDELIASAQQQNEAISEAEALENSLTEEQKELQHQYNLAMQQLDSLLAQAVDNAGTPPIVCSLNFSCPLDSYKYLTTQFGEDGHTGTDFAAYGGTPIHPIAEGVVITATWHDSYGYYVMVNHGADENGNTYVSLYAHMQSPASVSVGQTVGKGDTLGYVGNTGYSFGNHLHLELRVNNVRVNPLSYVPY